MKSSEPKPPWQLLVVALILLVPALYVTINVKYDAVTQCEDSGGVYVKIIRGGDYVCVPKGVLK